MRNNKISPLRSVMWFIDTISCDWFQWNGHFRPSLCQVKICSSECGVSPSSPANGRWRTTTCRKLWLVNFWSTCYIPRASEELTCFSSGSKVFQFAPNPNWWLHSRKIRQHGNCPLRSQFHAAGPFMGTASWKKTPGCFRLKFTPHDRLTRTKKANCLIQQEWSHFFRFIRPLSRRTSGRIFTDTWAPPVIPLRSNRTNNKVHFTCACL